MTSEVMSEENSEFEIQNLELWSPTDVGLF